MFIPLVSVASGDGLTIDLTPSISSTPTKSDADANRDSPISVSGSKVRGRVRGRGRGRGKLLVEYKVYYKGCNYYS